MQHRPRRVSSLVLKLSQLGYTPQLSGSFLGPVAAAFLAVQVPSTSRNIAECVCQFGHFRFSLSIWSRRETESRR